MSGVERVLLDDLLSRLPPEIDLFICCASFESRCMSVATKLFEGGRVARAIIARNADNDIYVGANAKKLENLFSEKAIPVKMDSSRPLVTADRLMEAIALAWENGARTCVVDVTTFTHEALLILLQLLLAKDGDQDVTLIYSSAADYDPEREGIDKWLSKGVADVRSVLGFPGLMLPSRRTHLIVLVGFEYERASRLVIGYEPNRVSLGLATKASALDDKHVSANNAFYDLLRNLTSKFAPVDSFEFSCSNPAAVCSSLLDQMGKYARHNVVVAPMNTKLSTIGCALAAWKDPSIQLSYAPAIRYNYESYSLPGDSCYLLRLDDLMALVDSG